MSRKHSQKNLFLVELRIHPSVENTEDRTSGIQNESGRGEPAWHCCTLAAAQAGSGRGTRSDRRGLEDPLPVKRSGGRFLADSAESENQAWRANTDGHVIPIPALPET